MLEELSLVLDKIPFDVDKSVYVSAIVDENVLGKPTRTTRLKTAKRLVELYALDPHCPIFRSFRGYWRGDPAGRPMLAFLTARPATRCSARCRRSSSAWMSVRR